MRLSSSGLATFQSSKDSFTETQKYQYTITFKIATSSESKNVDVKVNLIRAKLVTETEIETIMKTVKYKDSWTGDTANVGEIIIESGSSNPIKFNFASASFSSSAPNFSSTETTTSSSVNVSASKVAETLEYAINDNSKFGEYFSNFLGVESSTTPQINSSKKECTFTLKFNTLKSGYALSSEVAHLTTTGLTIKLTLNSASWQQ